MNTEPTTQDVTEMSKEPLGGLEVDIPNAQSHIAEKFLVTYGVRTDDDAMIFHFFAPVGEDWDPAFGMTDRLNYVTPKFYPLDQYKVKGGFTSEMDSYFVIVPGAGSTITDPLQTAKKYLNAISEYQYDPEDAS